MPYQALTVTTFILAIWISYISVQNQGQLNTLKNQLNTQLIQQAEQQAPFQADVKKQLQMATTFIQQQDAATQKLQEIEQKMAQQQPLFDLQSTYSSLLKAELLYLAGSNEQAAEQLKNSKDIIWQSGNRYPEHKDTLQGLMQPIDETVSQWQAGNTNASAQAIYQALEQVLRKL